MLAHTRLRLAVVGAGAWGTAMAVHAAQKHDVTLFARSDAQAHSLRQTRENLSYLPGVVLPPHLAIATGDAAQLRDVEAWETQVAQGLPHAQAAPPPPYMPWDLIVLATPVAGLEQQLISLADPSGNAPVVWLCKGLTTVGALPHELALRHLGTRAWGVLSGPSFAQEVARGQPTALVAASGHAGVIDLMTQAFHHHAVRVYGNADVVGAEVGGAIKNILAIATGLCDGLALGLNARAALITRGLAEMTRFGVAMGARPDTFMGLTGLGDLILTATGDLSRNRKLGLALAQGVGVEQAQTQLGHVAEGARCAVAVLGKARALGVDMPITASVVELLAGRCSAQDAVRQLMGRVVRAEAPAGI